MSDTHSPIPEPEYLTVRAVAELLQCTPQTVRALSRRGILPQPLVLSRRKQLWNRAAVLDALTKLEKAC
jgi:hypothetical protein